MYGKRNVESTNVQDKANAIVEDKADAKAQEKVKAILS